ncbi:hypothetical protein [Pedobacter cryophilus]|uniref:Uncharacterized protein n=1 Tax=Pedobacter cryophilus TaxID=2571271 RepID=A0A4U1C320_9SPHI|nr:hypothetical protein [Pedobacter cryophilus]TKC00170.1 hypothetical protein FA046_00365 [Pedobacter cryophilus]
MSASVELVVDESLKLKARDFAIKVVDETYDRFNYNRKARLEKIAWGKLGEEVFKYFLNNNGIKVVVDYNIYPGTENIDNTDFVINDITIDLKVGTKDFHKRLLVVKQYFDNGHQSDYYVGLNFYEKGNVAIIYGYATKEDIKNASVGKWDKVNPILDYTILYNDLKPIKDLIAILKS